MLSAIRNKFSKSNSRKQNAVRSRFNRLRLEALEDRRMLTSDVLGGVNGTVYMDNNANGVFDAGEEIANALVQLYEDTNNNNNFDSGTDTLVDSTNTNASGVYEFTGLSTGNYFAVQTAQNVGGIALPQQVSPRQAVDGAGTSGLPIDTFQTMSPDTTDVEPPGTPATSVTTATEALGGQRDFTASITATTGGVGLEEVTISAGGGLLATDPSNFAIGNYLIEWDGADGAGSGLNPVGLGGVDLTEIGGVSGLAEGICLIDVNPDKIGLELVVRVYTDANRFSEVSISSLTVDQNQDVFVPFSGSFDGNAFSPAGPLGPADFTDVGAVTLEIIDLVDGTDFNMSNLGALGTSFETTDFRNDSPAPEIDVEKLTNGNQADNPGDADVPIIAPGGTVTWTYQVTNTGTVDMSTVTLTDDQLGTVTTITNMGNGDNILQPNEVWTYEATGTAISGSYTNRATVIGRTAGGLEATDTDTSNYLGAAPSIDIEKFTNGNQADNATDADVPQVEVGSTVTWRYVVTNTGSLNLINISVTDSIEGTVSNLVDNGNGNTTLEPGEIWTYELTGTPQLGSYENSGSVSGLAEDQQRVTDTDFSHYVGVTPPAPAIDVEKATNGQDADTPGTGPTVFVGQTVTFTYVVRNTGNVALADVQVMDDNGTPGNAADDFFAAFVGGDTNGNNMLNLTEAWTFEARRVATVGNYQNTATATGTDANDTQVSDQDPSNHTGVALPLLVGKRAFLASAYR